MSIPNKPTLIAAAIYSVSKQTTKETTDKMAKPVVKALTWDMLTDDQKKPYIAAAEYLAGQAFGVSMQEVDRNKLAQAFEKQTVVLIDADPDLVVSVFVNVASVL
jgi:hypothetical protein